MSSNNERKLLIDRKAIYGGIKLI